MSLVSVIIPCYNAAAWLSNCIESALKQDFLKEIIIVDDFSADNSWEIIETYQARYPGLVKGVKNLEKGGNNARRLGFRSSSGEFIQWLDADDILLPGKFSAQVKFLEKHPEIDIVYSDWQLNTYNPKGELISTEHIKRGPYPDYLYELLKDNWCPPHTYLIRRHIAKQQHERKAWNPETPIAQDREYFTRAALSGAVFGHQPGNYIIYNLKKTKSVSNALRGQKRAVVEVSLIKKFEEEMVSQSWISAEKQALYKKALYSQLAYSSTFYHLPVDGKKLSFFTIKWGRITGTRQKLRVLKNLLTLHK